MLMSQFLHVLHLPISLSLSLQLLRSLPVLKPRLRFTRTWLGGTDPAEDALRALH